LTGTIKTIFKTVKKESDEDKKSYGKAREKVEALTQDLASATNDLEQAKWKVRGAEFELKLAQIQLLKAKDQVLFVGNYVSAQTDAAKSYKNALAISEGAVKAIDGSGSAVSGIEVQTFSQEFEENRSVTWGLIGLFVGVLLTLVVTRRRNRKKPKEDLLFSPKFDSLIDEDRVETIPWVMESAPRKTQRKKPSVKRTGSTRKKTSKVKTKKKRSSR
jgi:hypothetical protein